MACIINSPGIWIAKNKKLIIQMFSLFRSPLYLERFMGIMIGSKFPTFYFPAASKILLTHWCWSFLLGGVQCWVRCPLFRGLCLTAKKMKQRSYNHYRIVLIINAINYKGQWLLILPVQVGGWSRTGNIVSHTCHPAPCYLNSDKFISTSEWSIL